MTETSRNQGFLLTKRRGVLSAFAVSLAVILLTALTTASVVAQAPDGGSDDVCMNTTVIADPEDDRYTALVEDCQALLELIDDDEITGRPAADALNWNAQTDIFNWVGVGIRPGPGSSSSNARRVTTLNLYSGTLSSGRGETTEGPENNDADTPANTRHLNPFTIDMHLTGTLPSALGDLTALTSLNISCYTERANDWPLCNTQTITDGLLIHGLHGSIPDDLGKLTSLRFLYLQGNRLDGSIPSEVGDMTALRRLWLQGNYRLDDKGTTTGDDAEEDDEIVGGLTGNIPEELGNLTADLTSLRLDHNNLSGDIPATLGNLGALEELYLGENDLDGSIPAELGNLTENLERLYLEKQRGDKLTGNIPDALGNLENLEQLYLNGNALDGAIPSSFGSLGSLTHLYLQDNKLTDMIPENLRNLRDVTHIDLRNNEFSGCLPERVVDWAGSPGPSQTNARHVNRDGEGAANIALDTVLNLPNCSAECSDTSAAVASVVSAQQDIHAQDIQAQCTDLYNLKGDLEGEDNEVLTNWSGRTPLFEWTGVEWGEHPNPDDDDNPGLFVTKLDLSESNLQGSIPSDLRKLVGLQELRLNNNQLTGRMPDELGDLNYLEMLDLSNNQLTGRIPDELGGLSRGVSGADSGAALKELRLNNNQLTGKIPAALGDLTGKDSDDDDISLEVLDLSNNQLDSAIPGELEMLSSLKELRLNNNQLTGGIPDEWVDGTDDLTNLETLDLSNNQMGDNLNPGLRTLTKLRVLRLNNQKADSEEDRDGFEGPLPSQLGDLFRLQELDISNNNLVGLLPDEFKNLTGLRILNISNNNLAGTVPERMGVLAQVNLEEIKLAGNRFSGCLPGPFSEIENNDFDMLDPALPFCGAAPVVTPTPVVPTPTPTPMPPTGSERVYLPVIRR